jgi:23S rRNA pseudouridine1911/1915/1917 synthase
MTEKKQSKIIISSVAATDGATGDVHDEAENGADSELRQVLAPLQSHGERLDRALADLVPEFSRSYLQQLIVAGGVQINEVVQVKSSARVKAGDALIIELKPTPQSQAFKPEPMDLDVVFEDEFLMIIHKPAGLVVHPAPGNWSGTLLNGLLARDVRASSLPRAGIVHRLDKDTSGLMVVARQRQTMDQLVEMIAARRVSRQYLALAHGAWGASKTRHADFPIGRDPRNRLRMAVVDLEKTSGKVAATDISLLESGSKYCLVQCKLHTGRTHQIRVHMSALGHPLVSDVLYGGPSAGGLQRQALHSFRLAFQHPVTGVAMSFNASPPEDMLLAIANLGLIYNPRTKLQ